MRKIEKDSSKPLYRQLQNIIKEQIESQEKKPGDNIPSEKELCNIYGISQITARKAIFELVNDGALYRVPGKGTFVAEAKPGIKTSVRLRTENIAFVISREHHPVFSNSFYSFVFKGAEDEIRAHGYNLFYQTLDEKLMNDLSSFKLIEEKKVDGLLLVGEMNHDFIMKIKDTGIPAVLVDHDIKNIPMDAVTSDNFNGAYEVISYLIDLGHRKIGFVTENLAHGTFHSRFLGYKEALKKHHIPYDENLIESGIPYSGQGILNKLLTQNTVPTAIFNCNDLMAIKAITAAKDRGFNVPEDLSIVGFDDIEVSSQIHPPLTTVRVGREEMGALAVRKLLNRINDKNKKPAKTVLPTELVVRKSCKPIKAKEVASK
jgi:DNA-binding LacI/PurR family transcriptional regulator